jgi:hypothetical protein
MARLCSRATGNLTTASTWGLINATSFLESETGTTVVPNAAGASARSASFTPGAIVIDGIAIHIANRTGTTGTLTVRLWNPAAGGSVVANSTVVVNMADLPPVVTADLDGKWLVFKLAANATLPAGAVNVEVFTSTASQLTLRTDGTANNWCRFLRTTTTQAPVAGDDMIVAGEYTGAGTSNSFTVTNNQTAATDYGAASTSLVNPALAVCAKGTLKWNDASAGNPYLRLSGNAIVYREGTLSVGTVATPIPRNSIAVFELDPTVADGDFGLTIRNGGTCHLQGLSRTSGKNIVQCLLNTDEAVNSTSLGVDADTGWLDNDEIVVASTSRTKTESEKGLLNGAAGASTLTVDGFAGAGGGLAFAHSGTSPTQAEVILLTRNVRFRSVSSTVMAFINIKPTATFDADWAEFYYLGENVAPKRGIEIETSTGSADFDFCSFHDTEDAGIYVNSGVGDNFHIRNCVGWQLGTIAGSGFQFLTNTGSTGTNWSIEDTTFIGASVIGNGFAMFDGGGTMTNLTVVGHAFGVQLRENSAHGPLGTLSGFNLHCNSTGFESAAAGLFGTIFGLKSWRNTGSAGLLIQGASMVAFDAPELFGNATANIQVTTMGAHRIIGGSCAGDTSFATPSGIIGTNNISPVSVVVENMEFGVASGIKVAHSSLDVSSSQMHNLWTFNNCKVSTVGIGQASAGFFIAFQRFNQTDGDHRMYCYGGVLRTDAVIFRTAAPSIRMTPSKSTWKLTTDGPDRITNYPSGGWPSNLRAAIADTATVTISVWVRKSVVGDGAAYNGAQPRLILKSNHAIGITADSVLDTASGAAGSWEELTGVTPAATDDGVVEFYVDCDGTAGWVNVDDVTVT